MPIYVGGGCQQNKSDVSLIRKCITQNVRSATMAEPSASLAAQIKGSMILVSFLVLGYCLTGCLGVPNRPAVFSKTSDSLGSLNIISHISDDGVGYDRFAPSGVLRLGKDIWADGKLDDKSNRLDQSYKNRESSLKKLLENLTKLRQHRAEESTNFVSQTDVNSNPTENAHVSELWVNTPDPQTRYEFMPELSLSSMKATRSDEQPLHVVAKLDMIISLPDDGQAQPSSVDQKTQTHKQISTSNLFSTFDEPMTSENSDVKKLETYLDSGIADNRLSDKRVGKEDTEINLASLNSLAIYLDKEKTPTRYLIVPENLGTSNFDSDTFDTDDAKNRDGQIDYSDNSSDEDTDLKDIPHDSADKDSVEKDTHKVSSLYTNDGHSDKPSQELPVESLIRETVKKMETIMKRRVAQYNSIFDTAEDLHEKISGHRKNMHTSYGLGNKASTFTTSSLEEAGSANKEDDEDGVEQNSDELFSQKQQQQDYVNEVRAAVGKAVASRTVPRDAQFWRNVSSYLDSNDYLSRTRRSPTRTKKRNGPQYVHLSITYGHVMPCEYKDRFYCMNGGTCVFVGALDIKTCRCPIGYTGVRCEMIDQEYILSLLTNTLIFS